MVADTFEQAIYQRLEDIFNTFESGKDVSPAKRYRVEGYIEAAVEQGELTMDELRLIRQKAIDAVYGQGVTIGMDEGFIPAMMAKAPVKPSTKD